MKNYIVKNISVFLITLFVLSIATVSVSFAVTYTNSKGTIKVVCGSYSKKITAKKYNNNFSKALNAALEIARKKSTAKKIAKVTVSNGYYNLDRTIKIYNDTTLVAKNCCFRYYGNLLRNGYNKKASSAVKYSGGKNITINGGTWDALVPYSQAGTSNSRIMHSTFRFAHCKNIVIKNCTFSNNYNCHDIELGGVNTVKITKCNFKNSKNVNTFSNDGGREAVQIDCNTYEAVPGFQSYDKTPCKNVTVSYNTFKNKFRGVGSHHAVVGNPYDNISVHHNTFQNIGGICVYSVYWTNSKIYSNTMTNVGLGVDMRSMTTGGGLNFRNLNKLSYESAENIVKKSSAYIYDNTITLRVKNNTFARASGIRVLGECYQENDPINLVQAGTYKIYNVKIGTDSKGASKPNKISGNVSVGVQLNYASNCSVKNNTVNLNKSVSDDANGIEIKGCDNIVIDKNILQNGKLDTSKGVYLTYPGSSYTPNTNITVTNNNITSFGKSGIYAYSSLNTLINNNIISKCYNGASIRTCKDIQVTNNQLSNIKSFGFYVYENSEDNSVINNIINLSDGVTDFGKSGVYINNSLNTQIKSNIISKFAQGVAVRAGKESQITDNQIGNISSYGVYIYENSSDNSIIKNTINSVDNSGIYLYTALNTKIEENNILDSEMYGGLIKASNGTQILNNTISSISSYGLRLNYGSTDTMIKENTINSPNAECVYLNGTNDTTKDIEKSIFVTNNILNSKEKSPSVTIAYDNISAQIYLNAKSDGDSPYYRFKGDESEKYEFVYEDIYLDDLSIESSDECNKLNWSCSSDITGYRVYHQSPEGEITLLVDTEQTLYNDINLTDYENDDSVSYVVVPYISYSNAKFLGQPLTVTQKKVMHDHEEITE